MPAARRRCAGTGGRASRPRSRSGCGGRRPSGGRAAGASAGRRRGSGRRKPTTPSVRHWRTCTSSWRSSRASPARPRRTETSRPERDRGGARRHRAADPEPVAVVALDADAHEDAAGSEEAGGELPCGSRRCGGRRGPAARAGRGTPGGRRRRPSPGRAARRARASTSASAPSSPPHGPARRPGGSRPSPGSCSSSASASSPSALADEQLGQRHDGAVVAGVELERLAQRRLVAGLEQSAASSRLLLGRQEPLDEGPHLRPRAGRRRSGRRPCRP